MHHYGRLKAVCLGTPADGGSRTIWKGRLRDNDAYCMSKCARTPECIRAEAQYRNCASERKRGKGAALLIQQALSEPSLWSMIFEIHM